MRTTPRFEVAAPDVVGAAVALEAATVDSFPVTVIPAACVCVCGCVVTSVSDCEVDSFPVTVTPAAWVCVCGCVVTNEVGCTVVCPPMVQAVTGAAALSSIVLPPDPAVFACEWGSYYIPNHDTSIHTTFHAQQ